MRPVRGFERPLVQWLMIAASMVLIAVTAATAVALRRVSRTNEQLHADVIQERLDRQQLESRLAREQSGREALQLELARQRTQASTTVTIPTLTLTPLTSRGATPPAPLETALAPEQIVELRLELPKGDRDGSRSFVVTARDWSSGRTMWMRGQLLARAAEGRSVVPALITGEMLAPGSYEILLTATSSDGASRDVAAYEVSVRR
jgi:hypothetical protein